MKQSYELWLQFDVEFGRLRGTVTMNPFVYDPPEPALVAASTGQDDDNEDIITALENDLEAQGLELEDRTWEWSSGHAAFARLASSGEDTETITVNGKTYRLVEE